MAQMIAQYSMGGWSVGWSAGWLVTPKELMLRLEAQCTLCQVRIAEKSAAMEELLKEMFEGKSQAQAASAS